MADASSECYRGLSLCDLMHSDSEKRGYLVSTSLLEIVDLGDGEVVLQRVEGDSEPLVSIQFSDEANAYLMGNNLEIAKVMIQAGIEAAAQLAEVNNIEVEATEMSETRTLH